MDEGGRIEQRSEGGGGVMEGGREATARNGPGSIFYSPDAAAFHLHSSSSLWLLRSVCCCRSFVSRPTVMSRDEASF